MNLELLETFLDVLETRNFNRTAERLGTTQSTVSMRIRALEAAVGRALEGGARTPDIAAKGEKTLSTREMGDAVLGALKRG